MKTELPTNNAEISATTCEPVPAVPLPDPETPERSRNRGVARLPRPIRQQINEMLDDGFTSKEIMDALKPEGVHLNKDILHRWKTGGYQDYLREQRLLAQARARTDRALELLSSSNPLHSFQAGQQIAAVHICEAVAGVGPELLREAIAQNPINYFRMLNSFARLTNGGLKCDRHLSEEAERLAKSDKRNQSAKKGLSEEAIKEMQEKLKLM